MRYTTITEISNKLDLSKNIVHLLISNITRFPCVNIGGRGRHFLLDSIFFKNLKIEINKKIKYGYNRNNRFKNAYIKLEEWESEYLQNS